MSSLYGLSRQRQSLCIILFTDIFVGFTARRVGRACFDGVSNHLGLPQRRNLCSCFIATFPADPATIFKYWIFRYLNRVSPLRWPPCGNMETAVG